LIVRQQSSTSNLTGDTLTQQRHRGRPATGSPCPPRTLANLGGRVRGDSVALNARLDITNLGGRIEAMQALELSAGRDIRVASTTRSSTSEQGSQTQRDRLAGLYVSGGSLTVQAGRDIQFDAAEILNSAPTAAGPAGPTTLAAGRDLTLGTVTESAEQRIVWDGKNRRSEAGTTEIGSTIRTQGDLQLIAGQDLSLRAANLTSQAGDLQALAGRDLTLAAGQATTQLEEGRQRPRHA
jgi:filamentous hemagglutinin